MPPAAGTALRRHAPWLAIALAALLAHGGCVRSTFYLDDWNQIVDTDLVDHGQWYTAGLRTIPYLTYWLTYRLAGMSAPAFHLGNLLLHAVVAVAVSGFGREFLTRAAGLPPERARRVGWWAGVFFAVHPLCSEIPNYARARDIELVSLFALLAAWAALRWRTDAAGARRWAGWTVAAVLAGTFSKEVGAVVAGGSVALVWFGAGGAAGVGWGGWSWRRGAGVAGGIAVVGAAVATLPDFRRVWDTGMHSLTRNPRMGWHVLTESRVFWMYAWRVVLPVRLCSDHQIAWTRSLADAVAWLALAAMLGVAAVVGWALARRSGRAAGTLGALALLAILHRLANVSAELMVEYRIYPAMMFLCVLLAWGIDRLRRPAVPGRTGRIALAVLVGGWIALSAWRTHDWRSPETLRANIIAQYPFQARARHEVQEADVRAGRWQAVVDRQKEIRAALDGAMAFNRTQTRRYYDGDLLSLTRVTTEGNYALGLAHLGRGSDALKHCAWLMGAMQANHLQDPFFWAIFYYERGMVYDATNQWDEAVIDLRDGYDLVQSDYIRRALRRVTAAHPMPPR